MKSLGEHLIFSPSDLNHFLECAHLLQLERAASASGAAPARLRDAYADLLASKGAEHEAAQLAAFQSAGRRVVTIASPDRERDWPADAARTVAAMRDGADAIYQAVFASDGWRGISDFLVKVPTPSALGAWSYEPWDAKLARHSKPSFVLQLCYYAEQLSRIQARDPEWITIVLGTGDHDRLRYRDVDAYYRVVRKTFLAAALSERPTYPYPVAHCSLCEFASLCRARWEDEDALSQVAGIRRQQVEQLHAAGIRTVAALAALDPHAGVAIGAAALGRLRHQAALQAGHRESGQHRYELLPVDERSGFRLLPKPSPGDIFFDMEGDPFFEPGRGLEYLFGVLNATADEPAFAKASADKPQRSAGEYRAFRALSVAEEKVAFEQFIDFVHARLRDDPDLHVYHYAPYETSALKRLMSEHATREEALDDLLRREVFVDLYQVVRQAVRISHASYSIKKVRTFFMRGAGQGAVADGGDSIIQFERWRTSGDGAILDAIERYNEEDCLSTLELRDWLIERRDEAVGAGGIEVPWKETRTVVVTDERREDDAATSERREALLALAASLDRAGRPRQASLFDVAEEAVPAARAEGLRLLADLLGYHRREHKPAYWAFFERRRKSLEDLLEDTEAIAGLVPAPDEPPVPVQRSIEYALDFPPQEYKLAADSQQVDDPFRGSTAGVITRIDPARGRLWLKRSTRRSGEPLPTAVASPQPIDTVTQRHALARVADWLLGRSSTPSSTPHSAIEDMLSRATPRIAGAPAGATLQTLAGSGGTRHVLLDDDEQFRIVNALDASYLVIQGPPGTGKTTASARLIVRLIEQGRRVGVAANSHKAINNLLAEVERAARARRVAFRGLKKCSDEHDEFDGDLIENTTDNALCEESDAALVAGTSWLFARASMHQRLDYLFIDEAGQVALADAIAMAASSRNVVLVGDPQQLSQVRQGTHPGSSGASVLEHLLNGHATVPADRGFFLERSWRLHPAIAKFVSDLAYEGRLRSAEGRERQRIDSPGLQGHGLRYLAVTHESNGQQSIEEARIIAAAIDVLLTDGSWTDWQGTTRRLTPADILVVAPYNMQVRCLAGEVPAGVEVGTVDRFQGREAPVVFFSMASSSGEDVPRGLEFLFSRNRFNVAVSRAKAMAVVVASPRLLETRCRSVEQMRLVNALCRFVEQAERD